MVRLKEAGWLSNVFYAATLGADMDMTLFPETSIVHMLIDIHSHRLRSGSAQKQILTLDAASPVAFKEVLKNCSEDQILSIGIHPWKALEWNAESICELAPVFKDPQVVLVGEIGLDKACFIPFNAQYSIFEAQLQLAANVGKPVLLHVVRSMEELLVAQKAFPDIPAWIIHGFRGKKEEARQYVRKGFYLSFGLQFHPDALCACPFDKLFFETDDHDVSIHEVYQNAANSLSCSMEQLEIQLEANFTTLFPFL
jgi:TatD DNase family protein